MPRYDQAKDLYYTKFLMVKVTEKQKEMISIMVKLLGESRSEIVRRLLMEEAKEISNNLKGQELESWNNLIRNIEMEEDYHSIVIGEAVSKGMKDAYRERTGKKLGYDDKANLKTLTDKNRVWQRNYRANKKADKLKELDKKYSQ